MQNTQRSDWLFADDYVARINVPSSNMFPLNVEKYDEKDNKRRCSGAWLAFIKCCCLGFLLGSVVLGVVVTLWLKSSVSKATQSISTTAITTAGPMTAAPTTTDTTETSTTTTGTTTTGTTATSTTTTGTTETSTTTTDTTTTVTMITTTTTSCGMAATACTSCTSSCTPGLLLFLNQENASAWTNTGGGAGFTNYNYRWQASSASTATLSFQFYTTTNRNYWDIDNVSVKDSSGVEKILNGGFSSKTSWTETCSISGCASIQNYGPAGSSNYWVNCTNSSNYYSVSQSFSIVPCTWYNITFDMCRYKGSTNQADAFVYIY